MKGFIIFDGVLYYINPQKELVLLWRSKIEEWSPSVVYLHHLLWIKKRASRMTVLMKFGPKPLKQLSQSVLTHIEKQKRERRTLAKEKQR